MKTSKQKLDIFIENFTPYKITKNELKKRIKFTISLIHEQNCSINIRFCSLQEIQQYNLQFRKKNYPTDVLSFPVIINNFEIPTGVNELGDIVICPEICSKQAKKHRITLAQELEKMIVHGILHLKGFDHERNEASQEIMTSVEKKILQLLIKHFNYPEWVTNKL
jgi:probable rRNA maturation factor